MICALIIALIVAMNWPYYPFIELINGASDVYHQSNVGVYKDLIKNIWPVIILAPFILINNNQEKFKRIYWMVFFIALL